MFEALQDKLQDVFAKITSRGVLSESDVNAALREVRLALLEADVNFKVVKDFIARVKERAVGSAVGRKLTPAQQVIKLVYEELLVTLGEPARLDLSGPAPHVIMLVGLQGSGKTTTAGKLALNLRQGGQHPLLVAADTRRPAAITQLETLGRQLDIPVHSEGSKLPPPDICARAVKRAEESAYSVLILDTAGRLHIDEQLMAELAEIKKKVEPQEILLVADAMTGQDAVQVAEAFHSRVELTGLILTKVDGDARGGAAISIRAVTGVPIKFLGAGEKLDALEVYHPDRLTSRILGMGDVKTLFERVEATVDQEKTQAFGYKLLKGEFDLEDFLEQLHEMEKLGPLSQIIEMIPGFSNISREMTPELTDREMRRVEAIINSMTIEERRNPKIIRGSRKRRIAKGSGTTVQEVNQLLVQFRQVQRAMRQASEGRVHEILSMFQ
jgi:signal recognition particle subunit SRP54